MEQPKEVPYQPVANAQQPVAYDQNGHPLYAEQFVHMTRAIEPTEQPLSVETQRLWQESIKKYPGLNLSRGEYIISAVRRHPIGLFKIWLTGLGIVGVFMVLYVLLFAMPTSTMASSAGVAAAGLGLVMIVAIIGTLVASYVYTSNRFFLTNESVIQEIQYSPFAKHEQTVSLSNIEDASFIQEGVLSTILDYGTIRLSTEGDETTYRFSYVANPKRHLAILNNAIEAFKNGRPMDLPNQDQPS